MLDEAEESLEDEPVWVIHLIVGFTHFKMISNHILTPLRLRIRCVRKWRRESRVRAGEM